MFIVNDAMKLGIIIFNMKWIIIGKSSKEYEIIDENNKKRKSFNFVTD